MEFTQKFFEYNGKNLAYTEWGTGKNLLVCVHGLTRNGRDFDWLAREMARAEYDYTVICPSMYGRGKSDWLADSELYSNEYNIEVTLALANSYSYEHLDWVGTSMGGIMAMIIAATAPKLIRKMVLNDIGALISEEGMRRIKTYVKDEVKFVNRKEAEQRFREIFKPFNIQDEDDWQHMFEHGLRQTSDGQYSFNHDPSMGAAFPVPQEIDMWRLWDAIKTPTLILRGADSDILPSEIANKMAESENAELVEFAGYGHVPPLISQEQINVVKKFLC